MRPVTYASASAFRQWLEAHHASAPEVLVRFFKVDSGRGGIRYAEALDEALCFGWIDGVRTGYDANSYTIRFTPRRQGSIWSRVNVRHAERLIREGRMQPAGAAAFVARQAARTGVYSFENRPEALPAELERRFRADAAAWTFFSTQPAGYRRTVTWWIVSAKQSATRDRRLAHLIAESARGRRLDFMKPYGPGKA